MNERIAVGVRPSSLHLPRGDWATVLDCLCERFATIDRATWLERFERGRVLDARGEPIAAEHPYREGLLVRYFREVPGEEAVPFVETLLHVDEHFVVVDKPHFLAVVPSGRYVEETLLARLMRRLDNPALQPLHRIDRLTAGLVLFSAQPATRAAYQQLFAQRGIRKRYEAIAPALPHVRLPLLRRTRLEPDTMFFRTREVAGEPNSETLVDVVEKRGALWRYALYPTTGRKHQLRVQMAALGAPICNDPWYPEVRQRGADDHARPLQLLAQGLEFDDPVTGEPRRFESSLQLDFGCCDTP